MKIAVAGAGAVGTYFGGRLAAAGEEVVFLSRGAQLDALRTRGLRILSAAGDLQLPEVRAESSAQGFGEADLAIVAVKAWDIPGAIALLAPAVGPRTSVLPLQNGVETAERLASAFGRERVLGGSCRIIAFVESPGVTRHVGMDAIVAIGALSDGQSGSVRAVTEAFRKAGVGVENPPDIVAAIWEKFVFFAAASGVGAVTRSPVGEYRRVPETRAMLVEAMREVAAVARAGGVRLEDDVVDRMVGLLDALPPGGTSSLQRDIARGKPSELEFVSGAVVRLGRERGVPTPVNAFILASLLPCERKARGE